jgi:hypothetical protein
LTGGKGLGKGCGLVNFEAVGGPIKDARKLPAARVGNGHAMTVATGSYLAASSTLAVSSRVRR